MDKPDAARRIQRSWRVHESRRVARSRRLLATAEEDEENKREVKTHAGVKILKWWRTVKKKRTPMQNSKKLGASLLSGLFTANTLLVTRYYYFVLARYRCIRKALRRLSNALVQRVTSGMLYKFYTKLVGFRSEKARKTHLLQILTRRTQHQLCKATFSGLASYTRKRRHQRVISASLSEVNKNIFVLLYYRKWKVFMEFTQSGALRYKLACNLKKRNQHVLLINYYFKWKTKCSSGLKTMPSRPELRRQRGLEVLKMRNIKCLCMRYYKYLQERHSGREAAAIKIQAARRGQVTRKKLCKSPVPPVVQPKKAPRDGRHKKRADAANKIQAFHRKTKAKAEQAKTDQQRAMSIIKMQCLFRKLKAIKKTAEERSRKPVTATSILVKGPPDGPLRMVSGVYKTAVSPDSKAVWVNQYNVKILLVNNTWCFRTGTARKQYLKARGGVGIRPLPTEVRTWLFGAQWDKAAPVTVENCFLAAAKILKKVAKAMVCRVQLSLTRKAVLEAERIIRVAVKNQNVVLQKYWKHLYKHYRTTKEKKRVKKRQARRALVPKLKQKNEKIAMRGAYVKFHRILTAVIKSRKQNELSRDLAAKSVSILGCHYIRKLVKLVLSVRCAKLESRTARRVMSTFTGKLQKYSSKKLMNRKKADDLQQKNEVAVISKHYKKLSVWAPANLLFSREDVLRVSFSVQEAAGRRRLKNKATQLLRKWAFQRNKLLTETSQQLYHANTLLLVQKAWSFLYNYTTLKTKCRKRRAATLLLKRRQRMEAALVPKMRHLLDNAILLAKEIETAEAAVRNDVMAKQLASMPPDTWAMSFDFNEQMKWSLKQQDKPKPIFKKRVYKHDRFQLRPSSVSRDEGVVGLFKKRRVP